VMFWAIPVMTYDRLEFAVLGTIYTVAGIYFEERNLSEELGEVYALYKSEVPMLIPRLKPWICDTNTK